MIINSIYKVAEDIGFDIANADDLTQSKLINGLSRGFSLYRDRHAYELQLAYVVDKLDNNSIELIKDLYEFVKCKENSK